MNLESIQISNIWSFKYFENIDEAPSIRFDDNLNLLIGQNGAGKSTVLEIINFVFRRVLFAPNFRDRNLWGQRSTINTDQMKTILARPDYIRFYREFRLDRNYDSEEKPQKIRISVRLDEIDRANIENLQNNANKLSSILEKYSNEQLPVSGEYEGKYQIDIDLHSVDRPFTVSPITDMGSMYLFRYNLYKEAIEIYNEENRSDPIETLSESFAIIGSYRNYNTYSTTASLMGSRAENQIQQLKSGEYSKSMNSLENGEPSIFSLVRLRMAEECFNLIPTNKTRQEAEFAANNLPFINAINEKLTLVYLTVRIQLVELESWSFSFSFIDTRRGRSISDISALSAGQKAIVHLVFEAFGRGNLNGGLVIIDEPEIHLHYQFQSEYLRVIQKLIAEQACQYILVTHSESLISASTIDYVIRLSLDSVGYTQISQPNVSTSQKWLVKILDNSRSTYAFFGTKVLLVEGDSDRYFFRGLLSEVEEKSKRGLNQDIAVLDMGGKDKEKDWRDLFESFGLEVFFETDLDYAWKFYPNERASGGVYKLDTELNVRRFLDNHRDLTTYIDQAIVENVFILKRGDLEAYLGIKKDLRNVIALCQSDLRSFIDNTTDSKIQELRKIISLITGIQESDI